MEPTLWRWSIGVQISSLALITAFFLALERSLPRGAIHAWVRGWIFNFIALAAALVFWFFRPTPDARPFVFFLYMAPKNLAVVYLAQGAWSLRRPSAQLLGPKLLMAAGILYPLFGAWAFTSIDLLGVGQQFFIALIFLPIGVALLRSGDRALSWLAAGFLARGGLCLVETLGYASHLAPEGFLSSALHERVGSFLAVHSSFDMGTEWLLALGFVLAISLRSQRELQSSIGDLHVAQEGLRRLVDHDPLTALSNRRALPAILRAAQPEGATLLFFDLDDFKRVNDELGHEAGDRCLKRFADALRENFRPNDSYIRYGGDEFVVVAVGLDRALADARVAAMRRQVESASGDDPGMGFSVGVAILEPGGQPEVALRIADDLMYAAKAGRQGAKPKTR